MDTHKKWVAKKAELERVDHELATIYASHKQMILDIEELQRRRRLLAQDVAHLEKIVDM